MEEEKNQHQHEAEGLNPVAKKNLSLETYFNVRASADYNALPIRDLKKILAIHGFKQMTKSKKVELVEAVRGMELKEFSRSTLGESIRPAPMSLSNVIYDLAQLNWRTCPVVSVRSINSKKKKKTAGEQNMKKSGRSCEQASSEASVVPVGLNSEKKKLQTGPESNNKSGGQSGGSGEQAQYRDLASALHTVTLPKPDKLVMNSCGELARKQISCDLSGKSSSSGGYNSIHLKDYMAVVTGASCSSSVMANTETIASCSSSVMAEMETIPSNKRKREVITKSLYYFGSGGMQSLSK